MIKSRFIRVYVCECIVVVFLVFGLFFIGGGGGGGVSVLV